MLEVLQELQLAIGTFGEHRGAEWLHDLLDRHGCARQLIFGGTGADGGASRGEGDLDHGAMEHTTRGRRHLRNKRLSDIAMASTKRYWLTHSNGLQINISSGYLQEKVV